MNLLEIKQYMIRVQVATLGHLCSVFHADPETLRCMLRHWICKGKVRQCLKTPACGSKCFKCPALNTESYEWVSIEQG